MGRAKEIWMDEVERVGEDFAREKLTREEAMRELARLGLDPHEAKDMLDEAIA